MGTPVRRGASKYSMRYLTLSTGTGPGQHDKGYGTREDDRGAIRRMIERFFDL